jgi:hypothetical protein
MEKTGPVKSFAVVEIDVSAKTPRASETILNVLTLDLFPHLA